jgi:uncharacterized protein (TIGR02246 family)
MALQNAMSALDRLEVMELMARYQHCIDAGDADAYADNFVPDGLIEAPGGTYRGREAIRGMIHDMVRRGRLAGEPPVVRHFNSMPFIFDADGQRCKARTYMLTFGHDDAGDLIADTHWTYVDDIVKYEGKWLFERRRFQIDLRSRRSRVSAPSPGDP